MAALRLVSTDDVADPYLALIAEVCRELAARGIAPDPAAVHADVRSNALVSGVDAHRSFTLRLVDVYGACATPASWRFYAVAVIEESLRRRCSMLGTRVGQAAEAESIGSLLALVDAEAQAVHAVQDRRATAAGNPAPARLTAVSA
jgi:replicative DNA helicase